MIVTAIIRIRERLIPFTFTFTSSFSSSFQIIQLWQKMKIRRNLRSNASSIKESTRPSH